MIWTADLQAAIVTAWNASTLNDTFIALWAEGVVLRDVESKPGQDLPYCVLDPLAGGNIVTTRMSGRREIRVIAVDFSISVGEVDGDSRTAKEIAAFLVEEIMKVFGGHPTVAATATITLSNGNHLQTQYQNDFPERTGNDQIYQWTILYFIKVDVPVA